MDVKILTSPGCSKCVTAKKKIKEMVRKYLKGRNIKVKEINVLQHPEFLQKYRVFSTPAVLVNNRLAFVGVPREDALRKSLGVKQ